jgi:CTP synthase (UTP-ammonia lyase)
MHPSAIRPVRVGIVGDFDRGKSSHWATEAALFHAAAGLGVRVEPRWIATPAVERAPAAEALAGLDGIWGAPGGPFASMTGMLRAIEHARVRNVPYLGTCAGFQHALIELTRNVLGIAGADSAENAPERHNVVITPIACAVPGGEQGALVGIAPAHPLPGTLLERLCGPRELSGEYMCSLEANAAFVTRWEAAGLRVSARGIHGEMRAFELPSRRFFLATLFRPQLLSSFQEPHPIVLGFMSACVAER